LSTLTPHDLHFFREGTHTGLAGRLGACLAPDGHGARFGVWAPNAQAATVIGEWNGWDATACPLQARPDGSGIWEGEAVGARHGQAYKYRLLTRAGQWLDKADPYALASESPPATASRLWSLAFDWTDGDWLAQRAARQSPQAPMSIYEVHAGSWRRDDGRFLGWRALAHALAEHVSAMGFTHVELMPVTEHPFYGSWGYQTTGYFAPTARYGSPQDLMYFVDHLHGRGIGVILDWVPSHFPTDAHGLQAFDGTHLYEHADPRQGFHPEWSSSIFNYGRNEVRSFLLSSALHWLRHYHVDALRVDAVASMLYLDYARRAGEWIPNVHGGRENLEAVHFLRVLNEAVAREVPGALAIAEESTAWPGVTHATDKGGLGFGMKWNMGWMHDTLDYFGRDPLYRQHHQGQLTFSLVYAFSERFVLPLSHDEVVYGKGSLLGRMPGDTWQQFANLRALFGAMWMHPGKKLLFMGGEFGQREEWTHEGALDWAQSRGPLQQGVARLVGDLNRLYRDTPALHRHDFAPEGFAWVAHDDAQASVLAWLRRGAPDEAPVLVVCNLSPVPRDGYRIGVPAAGPWRELLNTDATVYGGAGLGNLGGVQAEAVGRHGHAHSVVLTLPPLSVLVLAHDATTPIQEDERKTDGRIPDADPQTP